MESPGLAIGIIAAALVALVLVAYAIHTTPRAEPAPPASPIHVEARSTWSGMKIVAVNPLRQWVNVTLDGVGELGLPPETTLLNESEALPSYRACISPGDVIDLVNNRLVESGRIAFYEPGNPCSNFNPSFTDTFIPWLASDPLFGGESQEDYNLADAQVETGDNISVTVLYTRGPGSLDLAVGEAGAFIVSYTGNLTVHFGDSIVRAWTGQIYNGTWHTIEPSNSATVLYSDGELLVHTPSSVYNYSYSPVSNDLSLSIESKAQSVFRGISCDYSNQIINFVCIRDLLQVRCAGGACGRAWGYCSYTGHVDYTLTVPEDGEYWVFIGLSDGWIAYGGMQREFWNLHVYVNGRLVDGSTVLGNWESKTILWADPGEIRYRIGYEFYTNGDRIGLREPGAGIYRELDGYVYGPIQLNSGDRIRIVFDYYARNGDCYLPELNVFYGIMRLSPRWPVFYFTVGGGGPHTGIYLGSYTPEYDYERTFSYAGWSRTYDITVMRANYVDARNLYPAIVVANPDLAEPWTVEFHDADGSVYNFYMPPVNGSVEDYLILFSNSPSWYPNMPSQWPGLGQAVRVTVLEDGRIRIAWLYRGNDEAFFVGSEKLQAPGETSLTLGGYYYEIGTPYQRASITLLGAYRSSNVTVLTMPGDEVCLYLDYDLDDVEELYGCTAAGMDGVAVFQLPLDSRWLRVLPGRLEVASRGLPQPLPSRLACFVEAMGEVVPGSVLLPAPLVEAPVLSRSAIATAWDYSEEINTTGYSCLYASIAVDPGYTGPAVFLGDVEIYREAWGWRILANGTVLSLPGGKLRFMWCSGLLDARTEYARALAPGPALSVVVPASWAPGASVEIRLVEG